VDIVKCFYVFFVSAVPHASHEIVIPYYIHTYIPLVLYLQRDSSHSFETPTFYQNYLATRNTADVIGGKLIAV
jgi:hypothetical protein